MEGKTNETIPIGSSVGLFIGLTVVYAISKYFMAAKEYPPNKNMSFYIFVLYTFIAVFSQLGINIANSSSLCNGSPQIIASIFHTFLPNVFIFITIAVCLLNFPGWLTAFSNTLGYTTLAIFKDLSWLSDLATNSKDKVLIKKDNSLFLNELTPTNFTNIIKTMIGGNLIHFKKNIDPINIEKNITRVGSATQESMSTTGAPVTRESNGLNEPKMRMVGGRRKNLQKGGNKGKKLDVYINDDSEDVNNDILADYITNFELQKLWRLVSIKNIISEATWLLLCGMLVLAYSYNAILNQSCNYSLEQQKDINVTMAELEEQLDGKK
jgi:hypothetical protein